MEQKLNLFQRINNVRKAIDYIQKDKSVSTGASGSYRAVTHDAVTALVRPELVKQGIICLPSQISGDLKLPATAEAKQRLYVASYRFTFVNEDNPEDQFFIILEAHAMDNADKAPGKALSYATKYAFLKVLNLETGEDEESRFCDPEEPSEVYPGFDKDAEAVKATKSIRELSLFWSKLDKKQQFYLDIVKNEHKVVLGNKEAKDKQGETNEQPN
jgi:hypothetical protein